MFERAVPRSCELFQLSWAKENRVRTINRIYRLCGEFGELVPSCLQRESGDGYPRIVSTCRAHDGDEDFWRLAMA